MALAGKMNVGPRQAEVYVRVISAVVGRAHPQRASNNEKLTPKFSVQINYEVLERSVPLHRGATTATYDLEEVHENLMEFAYRKLKGDPAMRELSDA